MKHIFLFLFVMLGLVACEKTPQPQTTAVPIKDLPIYSKDNWSKVQMYIAYPGHGGMPKMDVCAKSIGTQEEECIKLAEGNSNFDVIMYLQPDKYIFYMKVYGYDGKGPARIIYHTNTYSAYENITVYGITKIQIVDVNEHSRHVIQFDFYNKIGEKVEVPIPLPACKDTSDLSCSDGIDGIRRRKLD